MAHRKTKIVCTIGPASESEETLERLVRAGMDVARFNFSHGTHEGHTAALERLRRASEKVGRPVAVMQDLCGPKIRVTKIENGSIEIKAGEELAIRSGNFVGTRDAVATTYDLLTDDLSVGDRVLMDDGLIELVVKKCEKGEALCEALRGGVLREHKGINLPGAKISAPSVTEKDLADLSWGIENKVDYTALSFVRRPEDVGKVRDALDAAGADAHVIAKIEKPEALERIDAIIDASDGLMVARGDLGVEMNADEVPPVQKDLIRRANELDRPVITATQMLDSMTKSPRPTRAEVSDVANAIFDGTDAVMLSGETAVGSFPVESVKVMHRVALSAERYMKKRNIRAESEINKRFTVTDAVCRGAAEAACDLDARLIAVYSMSGITALLMSKCRPFVPIIGLSSRDETIRWMCLYSGVIPVRTAEHTRTEDAVKDLEKIVVKLGYAARGDMVVLVGGTNLGRAGGTNSIKIHRIGLPPVTRAFGKD